MKKTHIFLIVLLALVVFIFRNWLSFELISSGDLRIFYPSSFGDYYLYPFAWDWQQANGLGGFQSPFVWIYYNLTIPLLISRLFGFSWQVVEKVFFLIPFLIAGFVSSMYFVRNLFPRNPFYLLGTLIYLLNTYIFMMVGGGQIVGISLAYAVFPSVFIQFKKILDSENYIKTLKSSLIAGLFFALLIFFDLRFSYMLALTVVLYVLFMDWKNVNKIVFFLMSFSIAGLLHFFWVLPVLLSHQNPVEELGSAFDSVQSVKYFSFAKFENTISLLHPNWPENIFGKVEFMKPEFLLVSIFSYVSLLFLNTKDKMQNVKEQVKSQKFEKNNVTNITIEDYSDKYILFFALLGLIGAFLAKGANDPFGGLYLWMFGHIPGFVMFRDPTKWYTLVALSYSVLIPFAVWNIYEWLIEKLKVKNLKLIPGLLAFLFVLFWLFTIRQAVFGQLSGTFKSTSVPSEYISFAKYLTGQQQFSRTLWVPTIQRFGYSSANHPAVSAGNFFNSYDEKGLIKKLRQSTSKKLLQEAGIKYIVVPTDSEKELFFKDRTYSKQQYKKTVSDVSMINWLKPDHQITGLAVFSVSNVKDLFWSNSSKAKISYKIASPVEYKASIQNATKGDRLVFAESYDQHWVIADESRITNQESSKPYDKILNSFVLPKDGNYTLDVYYTPQKWVNAGFWISVGALVVIIGSLVVIKYKT